MTVPFEEIGRLPFPDDNVAIATRDLDPGTALQKSGEVITLTHAVLEGHRFAVETIRQGEDLLSWGMSFGKATRDIHPGMYICNDGVLAALKGRDVDIVLPEVSNFSDTIPPFVFDEGTFTPGADPVIHEPDHFFEGYERGGGRGAGTRNYIIILGVSSRVAGFVKELEHRCRQVATGLKQVDGVVGVVHTEGDDDAINNRELVLRTLAGFAVHPNTGAVLFVDGGSEAIQSQDVLDYITAHQYPFQGMLHATVSLHGAFLKPLEIGETYIRSWLDRVNANERTRLPVSNLSIALQCGGSDAFSGISGNPLAGWVAREVIKQGGSANLAETDELVGAEGYILQHVRNHETAQKFLHCIDRFIKRAARHGSSAAGNPSGGNKFRGLYNIYLKSLGAAMKKHPEVRLDEVIEYSELMQPGGFYFMDSPGNDLESIAGQVASGCNLIYFVTGNGSITNFPFVPTVKIVTTTRRFEYLQDDMDINAGKYLDGMAMDRLGQETLNYTVAIASGMKSAGEQAGHAQVQLWRNWRQPDDAAPLTHDATVGQESELPGVPLPVQSSASAPDMNLLGYVTNQGARFDRIGLVLPTSLCAGQVARMSVNNLNHRIDLDEVGIDRFVALVHTEGCGASSGSSEVLYMRTMLGHLMHPSVKTALFLEHGCEKTHNDFFGNYLRKEGINPTQFGWASIQRDGGIQHALSAIEYWAKNLPTALKQQVKQTVDGNCIALGILVDPEIAPSLVSRVMRVVKWILGKNGTVVCLNENIGVESRMLITDQLAIKNWYPTLAYAQRVEQPGFHVVQVNSRNWQEGVTGMAAAGVHAILYVGNDATRPGHPFVPVLQVSSQATSEADMVYEFSDDAFEERLLRMLVDTLSQDYVPVRMNIGNADFQITRGLYGISL